MAPRRLPALLPLCCAVMAVASAGAAPSPPQRTPLTDVLERAAAYVGQYEVRVSAVVAEEKYLQEVKTGGRPDARGGTEIDGRNVEGGLWRTPGTEGLKPTRQNQAAATRREMRSDVLMVQLADRTWFGFRDVIEVDGKPVRNREGRLQELFLKAQADSKRIVDASARYNIGGIRRNTNVPTFALLYLSADLQDRFAFEKVTEEEIDGVNTWVVSFVEIADPPIVKDNQGKGVRTSGRFWIVPSNGQVLKTDMTVGDQASAARGRTIVTYRADAGLGMLVPATMKETYDLPPRPWDPYVECTAAYSNYRRFQVTTDTKIAVPK